MKRNNNLHNLIKLQIIDKLFSFSKCANSTQRNPINTRKDVFKKTSSQLINLESAPPHQNNSVCLETKLDISMQRKGSKYLCLVGLKYYKENEPEIYKILEEKYLTEDKKNTDMKTQFYYLAHCIRNVKTNIVHNRKRFENRNYNKQQLQFNF